METFNVVDKAYRRGYIDAVNDLMTELNELALGNYDESGTRFSVGIKQVNDIADLMRRDGWRLEIE